MARIPEAELQHLKSAVSLVAVIEQQGRQLVKRGKDMTVLCPFHQEKTPSMVITPSKNLYHCFGCDAGGSVLDWVMKTEGLSLRHACERLRAMLGNNPAVEPLLDSSELIREAVGQQALLLRVVEFYHQTLLNAPEVHQYLKKRRLDHPELVSHFKLGFANRTLGYRLPEKKLKAGAEIRAQLQAVGLLRESGHEHFSGSLVVPVISPDGQVQELYGRKITDRLRAGTPLHLYLPGAHGGVWNEAGLVGSASVILCESLIDAMSFWCAGYRHVTCAYGVHGFTEAHRTAFRQHGIQQVHIAYDNDKAGNAAAAVLAAELQLAGLDVWRVVFPEGGDANRFSCEVANPENAFGQLLDSAQWLGEPANRPLADKNASAVVSVPAAALVPEPGVVTTLADNGDIVVQQDGQEWRIRGAQQKAGATVMKVNVQVIDKHSGALFVDSLDILSARARSTFVRQASTELALPETLIKRELGRVLLVLEQRAWAEAGTVQAAPSMSEDEQQSALMLLQDPKLVSRITADLSACGVVGESTNLLAGYLAAVSRKLPKPLAVLIQSSSAAGKSSLMDAVLNLIPEEERIQYSAMTGQSLFYLGETNLQHKILAIAEEEGVRQAAYALKLLQSDGELTMASTGKDEATGNLVTKSYTVKGPVMLMLTTTAIDVDEELLNRCLVLTVNESREQTEAIHALQRQKQTLAGLMAENERDYLTTLHQNAQRLLKPLNVVNPYASQLTFLSDKTRTRRDHMKYLTLIQSIALLHQYQRETKTAEHRGRKLAYIEVTQDDIRLANRLAHEILGRTLDEMPPQTRKLLMLIQAWIRDSGQPRHEQIFTRKQLRDAVQWGDTQLKVHLSRLVEMEYLLLHRRGLTFAYELLFDGDGSDVAHLNGLIVP
ncbi:DNA primase [Xenorhabdus mauleonii]|uniref:DNA primase n=1 Tax=Xenorhabdus mauleonii TaxID=351675 RepID=A0A1I3XFE7_9GAMM|nr:CHC2 zinc finger domain-containing protein [Xenorhabdus mauleonii]PHM37745.1 DNA primase [Xenorhabdus mauleonii]PHM37751.1 DNA primase [Xenorhabdus mauleonii]SFK17831.1 DNA primase, catalytic core [Xenorhabdus mauleonii]SFK17984.1 DNA primase, catalytic core [Xenorhabdus mauleonii]